MPTPPTLTFTSADGEVIDLNGDAYRFLEFGNGWSFPRVEVDIIDRAQRGGATIPYAAIGEREFTLTVQVQGDTQAQSQGRLNTLIKAISITLGANTPRFGVLLFDGYGSASAPLAIRCAAKDIQRQNVGLEFRVQITLTSEDGIWYRPSRVVLPPVAFALGNDSPVVGVNASIVGDPLPWAIGSGRPRALAQITYDGTAITRALEVLINGPSVNPRLRRADTELRFGRSVPAGTSLRVVMAAGGQHTLLSAADEVLDTFAALGDSFPISLAPGTNEIVVEQDNRIDGAYNQITASYRVEFISSGA